MRMPDNERDTRQSNSDAVYGKLRQLILDGELPGGAQLRASTLARQYGFGLTPLREALTRLQSEYLVTTNFHRGFRVAEISIDELQDLERVRLVTETEMLREALKHAGEDWEGRLVSTHHQLSRAGVPLLRDDPELLGRWEERHEAFHAALVGGSRSVWLRRISEQNHAQLHRYHRHIIGGVRVAAMADPALGDEAEAIMQTVMGLEHHSELMDAALDRDRGKAERLMRDHVQLSSQAYLKLAEFAAAHAAA